MAMTISWLWEMLKKTLLIIFEAIKEIIRDTIIILIGWAYVIIVLLIVTGFVYGTFKLFY